LPSGPRAPDQSRSVPTGSPFFSRREDTLRRFARVKVVPFAVSMVTTASSPWSHSSPSLLPFGATPHSAHERAVIRVVLPVADGRSMSVRPEGSRAIRVGAA
jgi:hypothetical protein